MQAAPSRLIGRRRALQQSVGHDALAPPAPRAGLRWREEVGEEAVRLRPARNPSAQGVGVHDGCEGVVARAPGVDTPPGGLGDELQSEPPPIAYRWGVTLRGERSRRCSWLWVVIR